MTASQTNCLQGRPLIFGEVLYDVFPDGHAVLGGAPFNVAWHLKGLGLEPLFVSTVGDDPKGEQVLAAMQAWDMTTEGVGIDGAHPTGQVAITLEGKDARFDIRPHQAYDHIDAAAVSGLGQAHALSLIYHGSLIARSTGNRETLKRLIAEAKLPAFVDVNLRPPWWDADTVTEMIQQARWVKLNGDELATQVPGTADTEDELRRAATELLSRHDLECVIVTLGAQGAFIASHGGVVSGAAPQPAQVIDTVGAGDAFSAVTIYGLHRGWPHQLILERALGFASAVVAQRGATSMNRSLYASHLAQWDNP